ncbi:unnamed protein product [Calicophoron daubneyi]|uniref:Anoctamin n=1 Tax=Calicophoron daubneyi TaxID=300641 RepID=A0AAV2TT09_CALDB
MKVPKEEAVSSISELEIEFCLLIPSNLSSRSFSKDKFQLKVAHQLAACFKNVSLRANASDKSYFITETCCPMGNERPHFADHSTHFVIIKVPAGCLAQLAMDLDPSLQGDESALTTSISELSLGQLAWLADLSIRTCHLQVEDFRRLLDLVHLDFDEKNSEKRDSEINLFTLQRLGLVSELVLRHNADKRRQVWLKNFREFRFFPDCGSLRQYFGDSVGFYFTWMKTYVIFLLGPTVFSLVCFLISALMYLVSGSENDSRPSDLDISSSGQISVRFIYTVFVICWALVCTKLWSRQHASLVEEWSQNSLIRKTANDLAWLFTALDQRPEYHGEWRRSRVTGEMELHFPARKRRWRYLLSGSVIVICLLLAGFVNILLLNLEGFIHQERSPWMYYNFVSQLAAPGALFDPEAGGVCSYLPGIFHSLLVFVMNQIIFREVAEHLTEFENHQSREEHETALVLKRFLFEMVDAYGCLAYLGFVLADRAALKSLLLTMLATDSVRRLTLECGIPWIMYRIRILHEKRVFALAKRQEERTDSGEEDHRISCNRELCADPYEPFDDYLEMVLQHGYLVLFAFVCPAFSATIAFISTLLEAHFDAFKMLMVTRRPPARLLLRGEFVWLDLLAAQAWLSIPTNIALFVAALAVSSLDAGMPLSLLFLFLEHALFGVALSIQFFIADEPVEVRDARRSRALKFCRLFSFRTSPN